MSSHFTLGTDSTFLLRPHSSYFKALVAEWLRSSYNCNVPGSIPAGDFCCIINFFLCSFPVCLFTINYPMKAKMPRNKAEEPLSWSWFKFTHWITWWKVQPSILLDLFVSIQPHRIYTNDATCHIFAAQIPIKIMNYCCSGCIRLIKTINIKLNTLPLLIVSQTKPLLSF